MFSSQVDCRHFIFFITYKCAQKAGVLVPGRLSMLSIMLVGNARSLHKIGAPERGFT